MNQICDSTDKISKVEAKFSYVKRIPMYKNTYEMRNITCDMNLEQENREVVTGMTEIGKKSIFGRTVHHRVACRPRLWGVARFLAESSSPKSRS